MSNYTDAKAKGTCKKPARKETSQSRPARLLGYCLVLTVVNLMAGGLMGSTTESRSTLMTLMASAVIVSAIFTYKNKRAPNRAERNVLIWGSLIVGYLLGVVILALVVMSEKASGEHVILDELGKILTLGPGLLMVGAAIVVGLQYVSIWIAFGPLANKMETHMLKQKGSKA